MKLAIACILVLALFATSTDARLTLAHLTAMESALGTGTIQETCEKKAKSIVKASFILNPKTAAALAQKFQSSRRFKKIAILQKKSKVFFQCVFSELVLLTGLDKSKVAELVEAGRATGDSLTLIQKKAIKVLSFLKNSKFCYKREVSCNNRDLTVRRFDGRCNNLKSPLLGSAGRPFPRFLPSQYDDGCSTTRTVGDDGETPLPNSRLVSLGAHDLSNDGDRDDRFTHFVMQWGQFVDHDITLAPLESEAEGNEGLVCCAEDVLRDEVLTLEQLRQENKDKFFNNPLCASVEIFESDTFFSGRTCHPVVRSIAATEDHCHIGVREQENVLTSFIDGSQVYGSDKDTARSLREMVGGRLLVEQIPDLPGQDLLPPRTAEEGLEPECPFSALDGFPVCHLAGDVRVNEQPGLTGIHTLWVREHNRIAKFFGKKRPNWSDERIYRVTRRIVIAQIQKITFNDFMRVLLSRNNIEKFNLGLESQGFFKGYDQETDPSIRNEVASVCFRFGHTLVNGDLTRRVGGVEVEAPINIADNFENNDISLDAPGPNGFLEGLYQDQVQSFDTKIDNALQNELFENFVGPVGQGQGMDLVTLNLERAREHGIGTFRQLRALDFCGFNDGPINAIADLPDHTAAAKAILQNTYGANGVAALDMFTTGTAETRNRQGGLLGPTFQCCVGKQFQLLKEGDRFYFENFSTGRKNGNRVRQFTQQQLVTLRRTTLASVLCANVPDIKLIQRNAFRTAGATRNKAVPCSKIPKLNLNRFLQ